MTTVRSKPPKLDANPSITAVLTMPAPSPSSPRRPEPLGCAPALLMLSGIGAGVTWLVSLFF